MTRYVLVPRAGGSAWYWHRVVSELTQRGHEAVAVELPGADPSAGLEEYRDLIVAAAGPGGSATLVAQSLRAFSAPLACGHVRVDELVLVNPMIPAPGESAGEWWDAVGWPAAAHAMAEREQRPEPDVTDLDTLFFHDLPPELVELMRSDRDASVEAPAVFAQPWPLPAWPEVPTRVLSGSDDRLFPLELQRAVARARLGLGVEELPGGHLVALSQPARLTDRITRGHERARPA
jgi:pimeloyl-ACP methyl ester carboxylesterase